MGEHPTTWLCHASVIMRKHRTHGWGSVQRARLDPRRSAGLAAHLQLCARAVNDLVQSRFIVSPPIVLAVASICVCFLGVRGAGTAQHQARKACLVPV